MHRPVKCGAWLGDARLRFGECTVLELIDELHVDEGDVQERFAVPYARAIAPFWVLWHEWEDVIPAAG